QMPAMNAGLEAVTGDIVCLTDDDAEPFPDWTARIEQRFEDDPDLGALGGRDHVHLGGALQPTRHVTRVGEIQWFGRSIGNHAQDSVGFREVDCLKGCNMSIRTRLRPRFDERLLGDAYQNEIAVCLAIRAAGMRIKYDPEIRINHFIGARTFGTERSGLTPERLFNNSFNHVLVRLGHWPTWRRLAYLVYTFAVGDQETPGLVKSAQIARGRPRDILRILRPSWRGKVAAIARHRRDLPAASPGRLDQPPGS
ncbi:MAG TPA: glycosyltransferase, partial [Candidatus Polarisedimenticolia bacterium]|nr:glycosyltransferase [Candidatus Polarisedimenticolia bacterium]